MPERKCKNWLTTFLEWTMPVSEAPESLLIWSGLFCVSAVLKRKVKFASEWLKQYEVWPTSYIMFVGPPGAVRKSTSAGYAEKLILGLNENIYANSSAYVNLGPTSGSAAAIVAEMAKTLDGSMTLIAGEFGNIVKTMPAETYDFFTKMFDNDPMYKHLTIGRALDSVLNPSLNVLGCTTPAWMEQNSGYMVGGGFAARTIFIFENSPRQYRLFYKKVGPPLDELARMRDRLINDLQVIGEITGEARPESDELGDELEAWYQEYAPKPAEKGTETFKVRKHVHALRTAYLLSLCERNDLIITRDHWCRSLKLIEGVERKLTRGLSNIGRNPDAAAMYDVLDYILANGPVNAGKLKRYFFSDIPKEKIEGILEILQASGEIELVVHDQTYRRTKK